MSKRKKDPIRKARCKFLKKQMRRKLRRQKKKLEPRRIIKKENGGGDKFSINHLRRYSGIIYN